MRHALVAGDGSVLVKSESARTEPGLEAITGFRQRHRASTGWGHNSRRGTNVANKTPRQFSADEKESPGDHANRPVVKICACSLAVGLMLLAPLVSSSSEPVRGFVTLAVLTPSISREVFNRAPQYNGLTGYVFPLPTSAAGKPYTLTGTGATGLENLDAYFYRSISEFGDPCPEDGRRYDSGTTETGIICPNAGRPTALWGIVVLRVGAMASFTFAYQDQ
jgi:hypothetical protein